jgi:hypothetical protein
MGDQHNVVNSTGSGCVIERETTGLYLVSHRSRPGQRLRVANLPCAYATCRGWERREKVPAAAGTEGGSGPG